MIVFLLFSLLAGIERMYFLHANSYPRWLADGQLGNVDKQKLVELRKTTCRHDPIEVLQKDGFVLLRCGFAWYSPSTKTYIAESVDAL